MSWCRKYTTVWVRPTLNAGMINLPPRSAVRRTTVRRMSVRRSASGDGPSFFSANFAWIMAEDMRLALDMLPWLRRADIRLVDHFAADQINVSSRYARA